MMEQRVETCCCGPEARPGEERSAAQAELRSGCCESQHGSEVSAGIASSQAIDVPPALPATDLSYANPLSSVMRPAHQLASTSLQWRARPIRAGPRAASDTCVRLQVFRC
jgi:hypothetical protein